MKISFDIEDKFNTKLEKEAQKQGRTKASLIRQIIREYLR